MRRVVLALASIVMGAAPALAQYAPPRPPLAVGPMAAADVAEIVQAMGLDPLGLPERSGAFYVQRATDDFGRVLRVTVDARRSQVIAIEAAAMLRQPYGHPAGRAAYRRPYPGYAIPDDDFDLMPPGSVMAPHGQATRLQPPQAVAPLPQAVAPHPRVQPPRPATRSAAVPPVRTPVPRKRPAAAPEQAAAGSIEPVAPPAAAAPQDTAPVSQDPAPAPVPAAAAPAKPAEPALTPVAPLE